MDVQHRIRIKKREMERFSLSFRAFLILLLYFLSTCGNPIYMPYSIRGYSSDSLARYPSSWKLKPLMPDRPSS